MKGVEIGVLGAGSWGTTLANHLALKGFRVHLWVRREGLCKRIEEERENPDYLPGVSLSSLILPTTSLEEAVREKRVIVVAIPTHGLRNIMERINPFISDAIIVSTTKGIEEGSLLTPAGIVRKTIKGERIRGIVTLSGPSFAKEVILKLPTAVTAASEDKEVAEKVQRLFTTTYFRVYTNTDTLGVELGGALKNVIAIAAGIGDGLGLGANSRAALITRGLAEIVRLGTRMGARKETFFGLSGLGDLVLTCTGELSRNHHVGIMLGKGYALSEILSRMKMVAEGVKTARSAYTLARKMNVEMPITEKVYAVLYGGQSPKEAVLELMTRELKAEWP